jgi:vesicle coat complex subunit
MPYLQKSDYTISIAIDHLDEILEQAANTSGLTQDQVRAKHENLAASTIKSYLKSKYAIDSELGKTFSQERDEMVLSIYIDLAICSLHKTINPRDIPELRDIACKQALQSLKDIRDGLLSLNVATFATDPVYVTELGSQTKFISKPFSDASLHG